MQGINNSITTTKQGEYWHLLTPGTYTLQVFALDFVTSEPMDVEVTDEHEAIVLDFTLPREVKSSGLTETG